MSAAIAQPGPDAAQAPIDGEAIAPGAPKPYRLERLRRQYTDYLTAKTQEIEEQREARRYYHGAQHTAEEIKTLNDRGQPVITYNRVARKIDGVVGLIEKLRQDPKAFPRTPQHEEGAELATSVLNFVLDQNDWRDMSPDIAQDGAIEGIGGVELSLEGGDHGDPDVSLAYVDPRDFFYDPRSSKPDFSDAMFMGIDKWVDTETAADMFPEHAQELRDMLSSSGFTDSNGKWDDREVKWTSVRENRIRLVEHWYRRNGEWMFCFYTADLKLAEGISPFIDEKGNTFCRFIMFSNQIDHDDDRYGFLRNMKGPQDEINHRRSKGLHGLNSRRIIMEEGAVDDPERARKEAAKPDGLLIVNQGYRFEFDDQEKAANAAGNLQLLQEAKQEIENFGPNPQLMGEAAGAKSGRAIGMLQQAGIAELGPFILRYRGWKIRLYRAIWNTVQRHWQAGRFIRVTDDQGLAQFIQINGVDIDPRTMQPVLVNALGQLDVDIILDEGPDQVNSMADAFDTLMALAQSSKMQIPPQVIIELSNLPGSIKKAILGQLQQAQQPDPMQQQAKQVALADGAAKVQETEAKAQKHRAETIRTLQEASGEIGMPGTGPARPAVVSPDEVGFAMGPPHPQPMPPPGPPMPPDGVPPGVMPPQGPM